MKKIGRLLFYGLPPAWRFTVRRLFYLPVDALEKLLGRRKGTVPPKGLIYTGSGDFKRIGKMQLAYFIGYCQLKPESALLDIGSGMGRSAIPLTTYLNEKGKYDGFDVVKRGVDWCSKHISRQFPNFQFKYIPLKNDLYRPSGTPPEQFRFPYENGLFDLIIVNSVFTHMVAEEVEHYFSEMARVLKPGGTVYATFFLFEEGRGPFPKDFDFPYDYGHYRLMDDQVKSANVAFEKSYLLNQLVEGNGFTVRHLFQGSWSGQTEKAGCKEFQDLVILEKAK